MQAHPPGGETQAEQHFLLASSCYDAAAILRRAAADVMPEWTIQLPPFSSYREEWLSQQQQPCPLPGLVRCHQS